MVGSLQPWIDLPPSRISEGITMDAMPIYDASTDFGKISQVYPAAVLLPTSTDDIANLIRFSNELVRPFPISAKGCGHSTHGQAQVQDGVVIEMVSLKKGNNNNYGCSCAEGGSLQYVDVGGGQMWIEVLHETMKQGLAPRSWTDYLYLTVGGTLCNGGISGQSFRHGPQISNVLEMDIVTGKGEVLTCSSVHNSELFYAVLGGLGQFGIITRARIVLEKAPNMVRWVRLSYSNFYEFTKDQEYLISLKGEEGEEGFDYLEGFVKMVDENGGGNGIGSSDWRSYSFALPASARASNSILYCLEVCKYYDTSTQNNIDKVKYFKGWTTSRLVYKQPPDAGFFGKQASKMLEASSNHEWVKDVEKLVRQLHCMAGMLATRDVSYVDFLNRVRQGELELRSKGLWNVPHPWLCVFVPRSRILEFHDVVFKGILNRNNAAGPIIVYPMNKNKWDERMSAVVPEEDVFYSVSLLRSAARDREVCEEQNKEILNACEKRKMGLKAYLPNYREERQWREHFGERWNTFFHRKVQFDPKGILATGQKIFPFPLVSST